MCEWRSVRVRYYESPHGEAVGSHMRLFHTVSGKRILGSSWDKLTRVVSLRSLLTWVAAEGVDPRVTRLQAGRKGVEAAMLSPSNFPCTTPRRREGQEDGVGRRLVGPGHGRRDDAALCDASCVERGPSPSSASQEGAVAREPLLPEGHPSLRRPPNQHCRLKIDSTRCPYPPECVEAGFCEVRFWLAN